MNENLMTLQSICFEILGKNLEFYEKVYKNDKNFKLPEKISERLLLSYISNSGENGVCNEILKFILDKSCIKNFFIYPSKFENVKNYDFLNNQKFDNLEIFSNENLKSEIENFNLLVNNLKITELDLHRQDDSGKILFNISVQRSIICKEFKCPRNWNFDHLHQIIEKASDNLEEIDLRYEFDENSMIKLMNAIRKKTKLKFVTFHFPTLFLYIDSCVYPLHIKLKLIYHGLLPSAKSIAYLDLKLTPEETDTNFYYLNKLLESLTSLETLKIQLQISRGGKFVKNIFDTLITIYSKTLKCLHIKCLFRGKFHLELCRALRHFENLEEIEIIQNHVGSLRNQRLSDIWDALDSTTKSLKTINIPQYEGHFLLSTKFNIYNYDSIKRILSKCSLNKIFFKNYYFTEQGLQECLLELGKSSDKLSYISFNNCQIINRKLPILANFLKNQKHLNTFDFVEKSYIDAKDFEMLCDSLKSSKGKLSKLKLDCNEKFQVNGSQLVELIESCTNIVSLTIDFQFDDSNNFIKLLNSLERFQDDLEEISFGKNITGDNFFAFTNFLYGCSRLRHLEFGSCQFISADINNVLIRSLNSSKFTLVSLDLGLRIERDNKFFKFFKDCPNLETVKVGRTMKHAKIEKGNYSIQYVFDLY